MKARNNREITFGYLRFTVAMVISVLITFVGVYAFIFTSKTEIIRIGLKMGDYDRIYTQQTELVASMDSLYNYMALLNTSERINDLVLMSIISNRKVEFTKQLQKLDAEDGLAYRRITRNLRELMPLKDSIRVARIEQQLVTGDLQRCIQDNRKTVRKLSLGNRIIEK